ncbi:MAG: hypothetical protein M0Q42_00300 [Xanthomonadales bacterium]|nr:hypothetical protein [Xanthomonadales bacterium]
MNRIVPGLLAAILIALLAMLWQLRPARVSPYVPIAVAALQPEAEAGLALPEPVLELPPTNDSLAGSAPPWAGSSPRPETGPLLAPDLAAAEGMSEPDLAALDSIRDRLLASVESGAPDPASVRELIQELIDSGNEEQVGGIDLTVLRDNLDVAGRIQEISMQMQQFVASADMESPASAARMQEYADQLLQLQQQYRMDFVRPDKSSQAQP